MDTDGTYDPRGIRSHPVPPQVPAEPPTVPAGTQAASGVPPVPPRPPAAGEPPLLAWLRAPRPAAEPGIFRYGHRPRPAEDPGHIPDRRLAGGALLSLLGALLVWSLFWNGYLPVWPLVLTITPDAWHGGGAFVVVSYLTYAIVIALLVKVFGRGGNWPEALRRYVLPLLSRFQDRRADGTAAADQAPSASADLADWPEVRAGGGAAAADRLAEEVRSGRMNDVDVARLRRAWQSVQARPARLKAFTDSVLRDGAAACAHPSGARDLPVRAAVHDLVTHQVRIGQADPGARNPYAHRGAALALDPTLLGTSLLAVGPPGAGKTRHLIRPVVESLSLLALAGEAAVVAVGAAGTDLGPDDAYDVVIKLGDPGSAYDLDLYGGTTDPDEAAGVLAEALLGDLAATAGPEADNRRAATVLAQLLGPYRAAHGRFPSVTELRELLDGAPHALAALREALDEAGQYAQARELDARERQAGRPGDPGALLADRVALLDRPAFQGFFDTSGQSRPFSPRALEHPLRVRIDLPERGHAEASRMLARLVLAQFTACVTARSDRSLFACLVLDDAAHTITAETVRGIQRLRSANAGAVLALRTLDEVPESLRSALLGAVGCRMALSGVTTWDGKRFAEAWGTAWVETRDITSTPDTSGGLPRRLLRGVRRVFTGEAATTQSVTVRTVERERWSASELAHSVPAGHAVLSLTTVRGEHVPPLLVDLRA